MLIAFFRSVIIYFVIVFALRFTGKRQIGELQPSDLVITILISEVAAIPLEESDAPLIYAIIPVLILVALEVIISGLNMKNAVIRKIFTGSPIIVINDGKIEQKALKSVRLTIEDLLDNLRMNGVFNIEEVKYAIIETNGQLSVLKKSEKSPVTPEQIKLPISKEEIPFTVIKDGKYVRSNLDNIGISINEIKSYIKKQDLCVKDILLMTADKDKQYNVIKKVKNL